MPDHERISSFLAAVRSRLERARGIRSCAASLLIVAMALVLWCLVWVLRGYAVPRAGYVAAAVALPLLMVIGWLVRRTSPQKAARTADEHFGLKDALISFLG